MNTLLLTAEQAAEALAISRSKIYELLAAGVLTSVQIGRCRRIPAQALEDFVHNLASPTTSTSEASVTKR
jgi:excisionase family DNA binding protein